MTIRSKIVLITAPLIITPLLLVMMIGVFSARNGMTQVALKLLSFKSGVLMSYMDNQWLLLNNHGLESNPEYVEVSKLTIADYAGTLIEGEEDVIFSLDDTGEIVWSTSDPSLLGEEEGRRIIQEAKIGGRHWNEFISGGKAYVADMYAFAPFDWIVVNGVRKDYFYGSITKIISRTLIITLVSLMVSIMLLLVFSLYLTRPLKRITAVIHNIIKTNDLSMKVSLDYRDEIGELGHYFNIMTTELDMANRQIKNYALRAVISKRNESKIRNIFQKYVPRDVIDKYYGEPESMLEGENRILGVLFSDIRNFTSFSEKMLPQEVVESLNKYFDYMVEIIMNHRGIVDKYIGDAIMAFFGAPVHHDNDAVEAVSAGLDMIDALQDFNRWQAERGRQPFQMGVGINYGLMTVGNIGTEKKMDYTVIGDMVNLASRMEGLTKHYKQDILVAKSIYKKLNEKMPCRLIDRVRVKGKSEVHSVYTVRRELSQWEADAWEVYSQGMKSYFNRQFNDAYENFEIAMKLMPGDFVSELYRNRCDIYRKDPPPEDWQGVTIMDLK